MSTLTDTLSDTGPASSGDDSRPNTPTSARDASPRPGRTCALLQFELHAATGTLSRLLLQTPAGRALDLTCHVPGVSPRKTRPGHARRASFSRTLRRKSVSALSSKSSPLPPNPLKTPPSSPETSPRAPAVPGTVSPADAVRALVGWAAEARATGAVPEAYTGLSALQLGAVFAHLVASEQITEPLVGALSDELLLRPARGGASSGATLAVGSPRLHVVAEFWWTAARDAHFLSDLPRDEGALCVADMSGRAEAPPGTRLCAAVERWRALRAAMRAADISADTMRMCWQLSTALRANGILPRREEADQAAREISFICRAGVAHL